MKVFIIHYKKLVERKKNIIEQLKKNNITNYEFIDIDRSEIFIYDLSIFEKDWFFKDINTYNGCAMAVFLSHYKAYQEAVKKYDKILILEDDSILVDNFADLLKKYLDELPNDYDMLFLSNACDFHIPKEELLEGKNIYKKCLEATSWGGDGATRSASAYVVNKKCAIEICNYINDSKKNKNKKIDNLVDWWLNRVCREKKFNIYWGEPPLQIHGSDTITYNKSY